MPKVIGKIFLSLLLWVIFILVILKIPYPESIVQTNLTQLSMFFIPLFLALIFTLNIFFRNIFISSFISLGLIFLLILKALDSLNLVTVLLTCISAGLVISYFKKQKRNNLNPVKPDLTKLPKIPKLTQLRKET